MKRGRPEAQGNQGAICTGPGLLTCRIAPAFSPGRMLTVPCLSPFLLSSVSNPSSKLISPRDLSLVSLATVFLLPQDQSVLLHP